VRIGEKKTIQNTVALNAEGEKTEDIAGTAGPPEGLCDPAARYTSLNRLR